MSDGFVEAVAEADVGLNSSVAVTLNDQDVLICNTRDGFFAVENLCSHQLQKLEGGRIKACYIFCPLHGQRFNLKDGSPIGALTDKPIQTFETDIRDGAVWVKLA